MGVSLEARVRGILWLRWCCTSRGRSSSQEGRSRVARSSELGARRSEAGKRCGSMGGTRWSSAAAVLRERSGPSWEPCESSIGGRSSGFTAMYRICFPKRVRGCAREIAVQGAEKEVECERHVPYLSTRKSKYGTPEQEFSPVFSMILEEKREVCTRCTTDSKKLHTCAHTHTVPLKTWYKRYLILQDQVSA